MSSTIFTDELIGLCDEISALTKVGLPLEESLAIPRPGQLGERLCKLASQLKNGQSLSEAIRHDGDFPPFYATVLEAGLESGNLTGVLDTVASLARQLRDVRLFVIRATLYPLVLFTLLWLVLAGVFVFLAPVYQSFFHSLELMGSLVSFAQWLELHSIWMIPIVFVPPLTVWGIYGFWAWTTQKSSVLEKSSPFALLRFIPWLGTATSELRKAIFIKNLALLIEAMVPLDRAIKLAEKSCGADEKQYLPLIRWARGMKGPHLVHGLRLAADNAQLRANFAMGRCEVFLPALLTIMVAITLGLAYFFVIEGPYIQLFYFLGNLTEG